MLRTSRGLGKTESGKANGADIARRVFSSLWSKGGDGEIALARLWVTNGNGRREVSLRMHKGAL